MHHRAKKLGARNRYLEWDWDEDVSYNIIVMVYVSDAVGTSKKNLLILLRDCNFMMECKSSDLRVRSSLLIQYTRDQSVTEAISARIFLSSPDCDVNIILHRWTATPDA